MQRDVTRILITLFAQLVKSKERLSPMFCFLFFIDDLELFLQDGPTFGIEINKLLMIVLLFADDMVILGNSQSDLPT